MPAKERPSFGDPKTDVIFKRIFGHEQHLLIALLNDLLGLQKGHRIVDLTYLTDEQLPAILAAKTSVVNVKCRDPSQTEYIVAVQVLNVEGFEKHWVWNGAAASVTQLDQGDTHPSRDDVVVISVCDFVVKPERDSEGGHRVGLLSHWQPVGELGGVTGFGHVRYALLELPKYAAGDHPQTLAEKWAYFFRETRELTQVPAELAVSPLSKAMELARLAGLSYAEREQYERELIARQDRRGMLSYARKKGFSEGWAEGLAEGRAERLAEGRAEGLAEGQVAGLAKGRAEGRAAGML